MSATLRPQHSSRGDREQGAVLILFALLLVGFLGLAATVIDVPLARLTQQQMQTTSDFAATEGLRQGVLLPGDASVDARVATALATEWAFDDDFDPAAGDALSLAAGPSLELQGGSGELNASALVVSAGPFDPQLQTNVANLAHGDMVVGAYLNGVAAEETEQYTRTDFLPTVAADAFLVRLRRTRNLEALDQIAGVSSSGAPLPFVFGLGTAIGSEDGTYNPRTDGLTVRSTSIGQARRAVAVPPTQLLPVGIFIDAWENLFPTATNVSGTVAGSGVWSLTDTVVGGSIALPSATDVLRHVGQVVQLQATAADVAATTLVLPILALQDAIPLEAGGTAWIVGFGLCRVQVVAGAWTVAKLPAAVLPFGSARLPEALRAMYAGPFPLASFEAVSEPVLASTIAR